MVAAQQVCWGALGFLPPSSPYPTGVPIKVGAWEQTALAVGNNAGETSWETCLWCSSKAGAGSSLFFFPSSCTV